MVNPKGSTRLGTASSMDAAASAAARAAASLPSSASLPPCETGDSGAPVTTSLATAASSAVSDESGAPTTSLGLTWSDTDAPMVIDDEAAPYNGNSAATRGEDSTNGGRHDGVDEDASASRPSPEGDVPAAEFDRSEGDVESSIMTWQ